MATAQVTQPRFSFNARSAKYHPQNAYWLSVCSDLSYNSAKTIRQTIMNKWELDRFNFISRKDSQCFIISNKKIIIISFRGTEKDEAGDVVTDLDMSQSNAYGGKVHRGFIDAYRQLKSPLMAKIKEHRSHNQPIWLTGHSLGGAIAVIAAMDLSEKKLNVKGVYTFGQPRVGDAEFTRLYDRRFRGKSFRFVNKGRSSSRAAACQSQAGTQSIFTLHSWGSSHLYCVKKSHDLELQKIKKYIKSN